MIYIIEIPHQHPPRVWSRSNKEQIISVISEVSLSSGDTIYEETNGLDLLDMYDVGSTAELRAEYEELSYLADMIDKHGIDTLFYKGYESDEYTVDQVDEWESYLKWNGHDLSIQRVYMSDEEARAALNADWGIHQGIKARIALKKELDTFGK